MRAYRGYNNVQSTTLTDQILNTSCARKRWNGAVIDRSQVLKRGIADVVHLGFHSS